MSLRPEVNAFIHANESLLSSSKDYQTPLTPEEIQIIDYYVAEFVNVLVQRCSTCDDIRQQAREHIRACITALGMTPLSDSEKHTVRDILSRLA